MAAIATATESELLLYRVLQRANLTQYFETFIQQGGDDIAQLCEAGEEEFLEIMALVGMASKPLHVRRLQKSLQEWVTNPGLFAKPIGPSTPHPPIASGSIIASVSCPVRNLSPCVAHNNSLVIPSLVEEATTPNTWMPQSMERVWAPKPDSRSCSPNPATYAASSSASPKGSISVQPVSMATQSNLLLSEVLSSQSQQLTLPAFLSEPAPMWKSPVISSGINGNSMASSTLDQNSHSSLSPTPSTGSDNTNHGACLSTQIPMLNDQQLTAIECAAEALANNLPEYEVRKLNMKKDVNREIIEVINMEDENPEKMILLRKYSAIYARFDSKRKNEGKMSLHEVSVNEASAQLCKRIPALLTRRDDLYPLSRRIVRDSGYQYSKGHSRATSSMDIPPNKKLKMESTKKSMSPSTITTTPTSYVPAQYENRVFEINKEINDIIAQQEVLKSEISKARENEDEKGLLETLRGDLEKCQGRQLQLRMEQSGIVGSSRTKSQKSKSSCRSPLHVSIPTTKALLSPHHKTHANNSHSDSAIDLSTLSGGYQGDRSCASDNDENNGVLDLSSCEPTGITMGAVKKEAVKESLLDEGLRIARQYGMCDLADEIKYMKEDDDVDDVDKGEGQPKPDSAAGAGKGVKDELGDSGNNSEVDEQEEWAKEVERDMVKLNTSTTCHTSSPIPTSSPAVLVKRDSRVGGGGGGMRTRSSTSEAKS